MSTLALQFQENLTNRLTYFSEKLKLQIEMTKNATTVSLISLGCPKNLVDSEVILGKLGEEGYLLTSSLKDADVIIVNTCSFIDEAKKESYQVIGQVISQKSPSQKLIVCGCLPQLEKRKLFLRFPEINALLGSADFYQINEALKKVIQGQRVFSVNNPVFLYNSNWARLVSTPPGYAYLKIAEGCSNNCSYCLIPKLRGKFRSRSLKDVIKEAKNLARMGVKELILIAQDITFYGQDKGERYALSSLLKELELIDSIQWIRILYTHPAHFTHSLIHTLVNLKKVCRYVDLPLQHTHNAILRQMRRPSFETTLRIIEKLREKIPKIVLRTTLMVGFPGEEACHFTKLLKDVERIRFDWLGAFVYSPQKGTPAYSLNHQVSPKTKEDRYSKLMELQSFITQKKNEQRVGKNYPILVDKEKEGHTEFQAPEIDGKILLQQSHSPGKIFEGKIAGLKDSFDLVN